MFSGGLVQPTLTKEGFVAEATLPAALFEEITELRVHRPGLIEGEARRRKKRARLTRDGRLVLVALDHPARGVTQIRGDELAMGDRYEFLARARRVLADPGLDGLVASSDVLEELLLLSHLERRPTHRGFLDGRVLVGSMNRGGLAGSAFEMEDTFTSLTAERLAELRCDGGKMMYRLHPRPRSHHRPRPAFPGRSGSPAHVPRFDCDGPSGHWPAGCTPRARRI